VSFFFQCASSLFSCAHRYFRPAQALAAHTDELLVEMGSDQTSCHNPFNGGYYPVQLSFADAQRLMATDPPAFKALVQESLRRHVTAINSLCARGMRFWDYGNSFMLGAWRSECHALCQWPCLSRFHVCSVYFRCL
jgi:urocanate hydratase